MNGRWISVLVFLLLSTSMSTFGATVSVGPSNCSASTVNAAIAAASGGDVIQLTCSGTVTWNTQVNVSGGKTLLGPGTFNSNDATNHGTWPLVITSTASGYAIISVRNADNQPVNRLSGLKITGTAGTDYGIAITGRGTGTNGSGAFRLDNMHVNAVVVSMRMFTVDGDMGPLTGLVDHNYFYHGSSHLGNTLQSWRGTSATCYGYDSLHRPVTWGGSDFVFFEDNTFWNVGIDSGGEGTRYVIRYNTFDSNSTSYDMNPIDGHGSDTAGHHCTGTVAAEIYRNRILGTGRSYAQFVHARSGTWLIYDNTVTNGSIQLNEQRAGSYCASQLDWNACAGVACCAAACAQCPAAADFATCYPLPNQIRATYVWNNNSGSLTPSVLDDRALPAYIVLGRDFFTTPYAYTPYPYPHPLQGGDGDKVPPAPPKNLRRP